MKTQQMKAKQFFLIAALAAALVTGCGDSNSGDNSGVPGGGGSGVLTVLNSPAGAAAATLYPNTAVSTGMGLLMAMAQPAAASSGADTSPPFSLINPNTGGYGWTGSGTYLVVFASLSDPVNLNAFKTGVVFSGGSATVDYAAMTKQKDLPN
jgi:hypothetical protein